MELQTLDASRINLMASDMDASLSGETMEMKLNPIQNDEHPYSLLSLKGRMAELGRGLSGIDVNASAERLYSSLSPNANEAEFLDAAIQVFSGLITVEPDYSKLSARILSAKIDKELKDQGIHVFMDSIHVGIENGLLASKVLDFAALINLHPERDHNFEFFGLKTVYDRYLLRHPINRKVIESPQGFLARVALGISTTAAEAQTLYDLTSAFRFMPSTPTLFNSATLTPQLSSCFLLDSPKDELSSIYARYSEIAELSKFSGGIGVAYHRVRSRGSLIRGTNGKSNGIIPWLKTLDSSVSAVNQGGKRKGACCVYLETWHADIEEFLELRNNTGDEAMRTHNLNIANWVPDLFMARVDQGGMWSLFDPKDVPHFVDVFGAEFEAAYAKAESEKKFVRQVPARDLYGRMMKTLAETSNGWMNFKDASNRKSNQTGKAGNVIHLSNLCTEILEVTSNAETAVCNLGSINLTEHVTNGKFDFDRLAQTVATVVPYLDRVIDINHYSIPQAKSSNNRWRPIGLGVMGLQDAFLKMKLAFDSAEALAISTKIQEYVYFYAVKASNALAQKNGPHDSFKETRAADGVLQFDLWTEKTLSPELDWEALRAEMKKTGLRNSLMIAIAPTATIASIVGATESIEPMVSNLFKRETLSGEFIQVNKYLVRELQALGIWNEEMIGRLKMGEGSIQAIAGIPEEVKHRYRTAWELSMKNLIDLAAARGAFIDQSQSLNLFMESPNIGKLSSMYMYAWKKGIKTSYYLRSRPATKIQKATVSQSSIEASMVQPVASVDATAAVVCSLENPDSCEACS
jgi:ribonucleoside-diphosphate reductase alpha chain